MNRYILELESELLVRKIDSEKAKRDAFRSMEYFFNKQVEIERETLNLKKNKNGLKKHC